MEDRIQRRAAAGRRSAKRLLTLLVFLLAAWPPIAPESEGTEFQDIYPDYTHFLPDNPLGDVRYSFMDPSTFAAKKPYPTLNGPPQCPYDTLRRGLKVPMLGKMDLRLFCVPKEHAEKSTDPKPRQAP